MSYRQSPPSFEQDSRILQINSLRSRLLSPILRFEFVRQTGLARLVIDSPWFFGSARWPVRAALTAVNSIERLFRLHKKNPLFLRRERGRNHMSK